MSLGQPGAIADRCVPLSVSLENRLRISPLQRVAAEVTGSTPLRQGPEKTQQICNNPHHNPFVFSVKLEVQEFHQGSATF
jgi:hypothetical protein